MRITPGLPALKHQLKLLLSPGSSGIHQHLVQHYTDRRLAAQSRQSSFKVLLLRLLQKQGTCLTS